MEPTLAEIRIFGGNFAPRSWAYCDGQLLPINQNQALFSILGTTFGGDGRTTFGLPDLRGRTAIHAGNGPGLSDRRLGAKGGAESVTLTVNNLPSHKHTDTVKCNVTLSNSDLPGGHYYGPVSGVLDGKDPIPMEGYASTKSQTAAGGNTSNTGGGQAIDLRQPWLAINYIIALQGLFPSRS